MQGYQTIIIIGAARSGTNMLRDIITQLPSFGTWPCDEINYIWRHGNITQATDELRPIHATEHVKKYILKSFDKIADKYTVDYVVEKTCANSLRLGFVSSIFPHSKYIVIIRDGRDVVASALKRWVAPFDLTYTLKKARFVPISDIPYYGIKYIMNRLYRVKSKDGRLALWGPRFDGINNLLTTDSLAEVCAHQWQTSIKNTERDLVNIPNHQIFRVQYENFVQDPIANLQNLIRFLGISVDTAIVPKLTQQVSSKSVGKWKVSLTGKQIQDIENILLPTLQSYGYK